MASVVGGLFHPASGSVQVNPPASHGGAGSLNLASITDAHATIAGGQGQTGGGPQGAQTVPGGGAGAGFDTVSGPQHGVSFAGTPQTTTDQVVAMEVHHGGNTVLHLSDGSTLTIVGTTHIDASFIH